MRCLSPQYHDVTTSDSEVLCDITFSNGGLTKTLSAAYKYVASMTATITDVQPRRGGTGGGVTLTITGTNFFAAQAETTVNIAGVNCPIQTFSATSITCITGESNKTALDVEVDMTFKNKGRAVPKQALFDYVNLWSSKFSWGGKEPPVAGMILLLIKTFFFK